MSLGLDRAQQTFLGFFASCLSLTVLQAGEKVRGPTELRTSGLGRPRAPARRRRLAEPALIR